MPAEPEQVIANITARTEPGVVAVDGPSASGKSTFAGRLVSAATPSTVVRLDDFYRPMDPRQRNALSAEEAAEELFDIERLIAEVLTPVRAGRTSRFQTYDWSVNALGHWTEVQPTPLVVVEGVHAADRRCRPYLDLIVLVETDDQVRWERMLRRGQNDPDQLRRWLRAEDAYFQRHQVRDAAHWTIPGGTR